MLCNPVGCSLTDEGGQPLFSRLACALLIPLLVGMLLFEQRQHTAIKLTYGPPV